MVSKNNNSNLNESQNEEILSETKEKDSVFAIKDFMREVDLKLEYLKLEEYVKEIEGYSERKIFDSNTSQYSRAFLSKLKTEQLIKDYDFGEEASKVTQENMIELANEPSRILIDYGTNELFYEVDGKKHSITPSSYNHSVRMSITEFLPEIPFDIFQKGIL